MLRLHGLDISVYTRIARLTAKRRGLAIELVPLDPLPTVRRMPLTGRRCSRSGGSRCWITAVSGFTRRGGDRPLPPTRWRPNRPGSGRAAALRPGWPRRSEILDAYGYRAMVWDLFVEDGATSGPGGDGPDSAVGGRARGNGARVLREARPPARRRAVPGRLGAVARRPARLADGRPTWPRPRPGEGGGGGQQVLAEAAAGWGRLGSAGWSGAPASPPPGRRWKPGASPPRGRDLRHGRGGPRRRTWPRPACSAIRPP